MISPSAPTVTSLRYSVLPLGPSKPSDLSSGDGKLSSAPSPGFILLSASACSSPRTPTCIPGSHGLLKVPCLGHRHRGLWSLQACFSLRHTRKFTMHETGPVEWEGEGSLSANTDFQSCSYCCFINNNNKSCHLLPTLLKPLNTGHVILTESDEEGTMTAPSHRW